MKGNEGRVVFRPLGSFHDLPTSEGFPVDPDGEETLRKSVYC